MGKDLYSVLGLQKNASENDIKKAYKKKAMIYHPDRNINNKEEAETKFKEVSNAYSILNDPSKKKHYDMFGEEGLESLNSNSDFNPFNIFQSVFSGGGGNMPGGFGSMFGNFGGMDNSPNEPKKGNDKKITINISLKDLYLGKNLNIDLNKKIRCEECKGEGALKHNIILCQECQGTGKYTKVIKMGPMIQHIVQTCSLCKGRAKRIKPGSECQKCLGKKYVNYKKKLNLYIKPGTTSGTKYNFKGDADWEEGCQYSGDLIIFINQIKDSMFKREGQNLIIDKNISLVDALTDLTFYIKHFDNRVLEVKHTNIINNDDILKIEGEGMKDIDNEELNGDLLINFKVVFPTKLNDERKKYLKLILPKSPDQSNPDLESKPDKEIKFMKKVDKEQYSKHTETFMNEDDESVGQRVECAQQ